MYDRSSDVRIPDIGRPFFIESDKCRLFLIKCKAVIQLRVRSEADYECSIDGVKTDSFAVYRNWMVIHYNKRLRYIVSEYRKLHFRIDSSSGLESVTYQIKKKWIVEKKRENKRKQEVICKKAEKSSLYGSCNIFPI